MNKYKTRQGIKDKYRWNNDISIKNLPLNLKGLFPKKDRIMSNYWD